MKRPASRIGSQRRMANPLSLTRRRFLRGAAGSMVGLPLLASLQARGQSPVFPKRFVVIHHPNGVVPTSWFPQAGASETDFTLGPTHEALAPFKDDLILFNGINMPSLALGPGEPHQKGMAGVLSGWHLLDANEQNGSFVGGDGSLTGWGRSMTVDQRIAQSHGQATQFPSLQIGVRATTSEVRSRLSYLGSAQPLPPQNNPQLLFDQLFQDHISQDGNLAELRLKRKSVLDSVLQQFEIVRGQMPSEERSRMTDHFDFVRDIEERIDSEMLQGEFCSIPGRPVDMLVDHEDNMPMLTTLQLDLMAMALTCDLTRVITLQFSNAQNHVRFPWLDTTPEDPDLFSPSLGDGHSLSHSGVSSIQQQKELGLRDQWYAQQVAYFLGKLKSVPEGDGTLLDNTLVLWLSEIAVGNTHSQSNMPFLIAGKGGSSLQTGRYIQYASGVSHCDFLNSLLRIYNIDNELFGNPDFSEGPLPGFF
jgi:hypothetical protein